MYLVLGGSVTPLQQHFQLACNERNENVVFLADLDSTIAFDWSFDSRDSNWVLETAAGTRLDHAEITGVLMQRPPRLDPAADSVEQLEYSQVERNAVLFAWFWSLSCPVINRYPPAFWFAPRVPLSFWRPLIVKCGLQTTESIFSNEESELRAFASSHGGHVSYSPVCDFGIYRIATEQDWVGVNKMTAICPVNLVSIPAPMCSACIVGQEVFWSTSVTAPYLDTGDRLKRLAVLAGLDFLEVRLAIGEDFQRIVGVEPFPSLETFDEPSIRNIAGALCTLLRSGGTVVPSGLMRQKR